MANLEGTYFRTIFFFTYLPIHFDAGLSSELPTRQVCVVTWVDIVVRQGLVHVLVDVQPIQEDWGVLVWHQVVGQPFFAYHIWKKSERDINNSQFKLMVLLMGELTMVKTNVFLFFLRSWNSIECRIAGKQGHIIECYFQTDSLNICSPTMRGPWIGPAASVHI